MKDEPSSGRYSWTAKTLRVESRDPDEVAITLLGVLANTPERLGRFLETTGLAADNLRRAAAEPSFSAAILEYVASDEALLLELASESGLTPSVIGAAHAALNRPFQDDGT